MILTTTVAKTDIFNFRVSFPTVIVMRDGVEFSIFGENPVVLLNREQAPGIGMSLFNKDGGEKYRCCSYAVLCYRYRFTTFSEVAKRKINTRDNTVSKESPLFESSLH